MRVQKKLAVMSIGAAAIFGLTGCGTSLADSCEDFYEFDQEYATEIDRVMSTATSPDASDEDKAKAQDFVQEAREAFEEIVADADDEELLSSAGDTRATYALFQRVVEPDMTQEDQ